VVSAPGGELLAQWRLAVPLAAQQVGLQLMGSVDTAILGHYSATALAGVGVATGLVFALTCAAMGLVLGLDSVVPRAVGAGDADRADRALLAGLRIAVLVGLPTTLLVWGARWALPYFGAEPAVAAEAHSYVLGRTFGVIPFLLSVAMRAYLAAHGRTYPLLVAVIGGNLVNAAGDYVLIFGDAGLVRLGLPALGVPELGAFGAALATALVQIATVVIYGFAIARLRRDLGRPPLRKVLATRLSEAALTALRADPKWKGSEVATITYHGLPIGLHLLAEVGVFAVAGILAARLGTAAAGAHSIAITIASFTFSATVGIGSATAVRVGLAIGAGGPEAMANARHRGMVGLGVGISVMSVGALCFLLFPGALASIFTDDAELLALAPRLLFIAALFQLYDGIQAVAAGALRGAADNRVTMWANMAGHYAIGLPVSLALGFGTSLGVRGIWWGLSAGLAFTAAMLVWRFLRVTASSENRTK
jgi:multidrug resistance protein, MATE family